MKLRDHMRDSYYKIDDLLNRASNKRISKNVNLKNKHKNEKVFLLLTGESIQLIDLKKLKNEFTFGVNLIFLHKDIKDINLNYYSNFDDNRILKPNLEQWPKKHLGELGDNGALKFYSEIVNRLSNSTKLILNSVNYKHYVNHPSFKKYETYYCKKGKKINKDNFLVDLTKRMGGGGSIYYSIFILIYMGFSEIYLCGAGYTYDPIYYWHFYDDECNVFPSNMQKDDVSKIIGENLNKINILDNTDLKLYDIIEKDGYLRGVTTLKLDNGERLRNHMLMNKIANYNNVKIINVTPSGFESPIYEKISWTDIENDILKKNE